MFAQSISQENFSKKQQPLKEVVLDPVKYLSQMRHGYRRMLNDLLKKSAYMPNIAFSQETIGRHSGHYTRRYTNTGLKVLEELGFIVSEYRHRKTKIYRLSTYFLIPGVRLMLARLLPALAMCINFQFSPIRSKLLFIKNRVQVATYSRVATCTLTQKCKKRREGMTPQEAIEKIRSFTPTKWGKLKLTAYPAEAILYAEENFPERYQGSPYSSFDALCSHYCRENSLRPDWKAAYQLLEHSGMPQNAALYEKTNLRTSFLQSKQTNHTPTRNEEYDRNFPKRGNSNQATKIKPFQASVVQETTAEVEEDLNKFTALKSAGAHLNKIGFSGKSGQEYFEAAYQNRQTQYIPHITDPVEIVDRSPVPDVSWIVKAWLDSKDELIRNYGEKNYLHFLVQGIERQINYELNKIGRDDARFKVIAEMRARFRYHEDVK